MLAPLTVKFFSGLVTRQFINFNLRLNIDVAKSSESCFPPVVLPSLARLVMREFGHPPVNLSQKFL